MEAREELRNKRFYEERTNRKTEAFLKETLDNSKKILD